MTYQFVVGRCWVKTIAPSCRNARLRSLICACIRKRAQADSIVHVEEDIPNVATSVQSANNRYTAPGSYPSQSGGITVVNHQLATESSSLPASGARSQQNHRMGPAQVVRTDASVSTRIAKNVCPKEQCIESHHGPSY